MTVDEYSTDPLVKDTVTRLAAEFGGRVPRRVVLTTVTDARRDLEGQIVPEAFGEMLHRLAHHRLGTLPTGASR
ncbi:MAG: hypothetical protein HOV94_12550 [Saccharothrix sp.]|nr:hypothetical protein [Saccharothrix sp.]